jgi:hypothetical protein
VGSSGTEFLLLYGDIVTALALAHGRGQGESSAASLARGLESLYMLGEWLGFKPLGRPFFHPRVKGMRNAATGEHVICLRPKFQGDRVLPEATIAVWSHQPTGVGEEQVWERVAAPLTVSYDEAKIQGDRPHGAE